MSRFGADLGGVPAEVLDTESGKTIDSRRDAETQREKKEKRRHCSPSLFSRCSLSASQRLCVRPILFADLLGPKDRARTTQGLAVVPELSPSARRDGTSGRRRSRSA